MRAPLSGWRSFTRRGALTVRPRVKGSDRRSESHLARDVRAIDRVGGRPRARRGGAHRAVPRRRCAADPDVAEVIVVDDGSTDGTARAGRARAARAWSRRARRRPGWVGKPWALQQGLEAAARRRRRQRSTPTPARGPASPRALAAALAGRRPRHRRRALRLRHAGRALAAPGAAGHARLPLRPAGHRVRPSPRPAVVNGQCTAVRRERAARRGRLRARAPAHMTDDAALARGAGRRAAGASPSTTPARCSRCDMHESGARDVARVGTLDRARRRDAAGLAGAPTSRSCG